jgi:FKBP-type peptidyl-prolyl cis-trans isomerase (trigger factor)
VSPAERSKKARTKRAATKREISVEIPVEDVNRQTEALIQKYQKVARIPGFRRGHVPASIIRQRFSEEIKTDMVEALIPQFFRRGSRASEFASRIAATSHRPAPARRRTAAV